MTLGTRIVVMKEGVVQQVDTPQNLYNEPGNLFVAGFIGSPQMNFMDAVVEEKGSSIILNVGGQEFTLPENKAKVLKEKGYVGKTVVAGIRPENVDDDPESLAKYPNSTFEAKINVYELLGAEVFLYFDFAGTPMTARVQPGTPARTGSTVKFAIEIDKMHIFDKDTELAICH